MRTTREQHQEGSRGCLVQQETNQFESRWVGPVSIFHDEEHRLMFSKFQQDRDESFQGLLPLPLW